MTPVSWRVKTGREFLYNKNQTFLNSEHHSPKLVWVENEGGVDVTWRSWRLSKEETTETMICCSSKWECFGDFSMFFFLSAGFMTVGGWGSKMLPFEMVQTIKLQDAELLALHAELVSHITRFSYIPQNSTETREDHGFGTCISSSHHGDVGGIYVVKFRGLILVVTQLTM